jgi:predicted nucleotidyltransferase
MEKKLIQLVERLTKGFGDRLISVVLYGSAAAGDHHASHSDLNVLCVLKAVTPAELADAEPVFRWWRGQGNPSPLLLSLEELRTSTDCFPIEFTDIRQTHRILHGEDVVEGMEIDTTFYRAQVEHELRAKLLRLRQKAGGVLSTKDMLLKLMTDSVSTFCVLMRHALRLAGEECGVEKREIVEHAAARFGVNAKPFSILLDLRERKIKPRDIDPRPLFGSYLESIDAAVAAVDRLER